jgi:methyl-accepting chemotaxis protein
MGITSVKIKTTLLSFGAIGTIFVTLLGSIGYWSTIKLDNSMQATIISSKALRASMEADMMHDALRADAYSLALTSQLANNNLLEIVHTNIAEINAHGASFKENFEIVAKLNTDKKVQADLKKVRPKIDVYITAVTDLYEHATVENTLNAAIKAKDQAAISQAKANMHDDELNQHLYAAVAAFAVLENEMNTLGNDIEQSNKNTQNLADKTARNVKKIIIISGLIAAFLLMLMAYSVVQAITKPLDEALKVAETVAAGDLTAEINITSNNELSQLLKSLKLMQQNLHKLVAQIKESAESISTGAQQISAGNTNLSQRTEEQASSLEETASSMEQMASTVKQNAENAKQANIMATEASAVAIRGGNAVNQVVNTMADINSSSKKIVDIISVIDSIAFQTNILALNAAVEAARAGEQGRGFAVVAAEVRSLAQRSATAAKEIKQLISDSVEKVSDGTKQVQAAGETMAEIVTAVNMVTDIVNEIAAASYEQSAGIDQVNNAITNMDEVTQQNAALVEQAAAAANSLESKAYKLTDATAKFKLANTNKLQDSNSNDFKIVKEPAINELPNTKQNNKLYQLKPPKTSANEFKDWDEF